MSRAVVQAPATVGNFGPGFDTTSLALHGLGDRIELREAREDRILLEGPGAGGVPDQWHLNVAGIALDHLRTRTGVDTRFEVRIRKRLPGGSGLGSSASSAGGAALAFHALHPRARLGPADLVRAAGEGEAAASGRHYDDVASVVLGGLAIVRVRDDEIHLSRVPPPTDLHLAVVVPALRLLTREMRRILPDRVTREEAVQNVGNVAALVHAFHKGDIATIGACLEDHIAVPGRKKLILFYDEVRVAAKLAGAFGVTLSGSGPAMVAVCDSRRLATRVGDAMRGAVESHKVRAEAFAAVPEREVMHRAVALR